MGEVMDRGTEALKSHLSGTEKMDVRQTRRGWCQELLGCEARTEFKYFIGDNQVAHSLEDSDCCCRFWCSPNHPFTMQIKELNTEAEMLTMERPCRCPAGGCKCCCYQEMSVTSGGEALGHLKEDCYFCVPQFSIFGPSGSAIYKVHPPTCCAGVCVNCFTEGNPCCGKGCCKVPFRVYPADQNETGGDADYVGKILKKPKSLMVEVFTEANAFEVEFPQNSGSVEKGLLLGSSVFINALFFEENGEGGDS